MPRCCGPSSGMRSPVIFISRPQSQTPEKRVPGELEPRIRSALARCSWSTGQRQDGRFEKRDGSSDEKIHASCRGNLSGALFGSAHPLRWAEMLPTLLRDAGRRASSWNCRIMKSMLVRSRCEPSSRSRGRLHSTEDSHSTHDTEVRCGERGMGKDTRSGKWHVPSNSCRRSCIQPRLACIGAVSICSPPSHKSTIALHVVAWYHDRSCQSERESPLSLTAKLSQQVSANIQFQATKVGAGVPHSNCHVQKISTPQSNSAR